jgi:hypothetical protein
MKIILIAISILFSFYTNAQELFVVTEPASNMAAGSIAVRLAQSFMNEKSTNTTNYHAMPEIMIGINKKIMIHATSFLSNRSNKLVLEGGSIYSKYRFYTVDDLHKHFRMATFVRASLNNADVHQEEINTIGHNSGLEVGFIATKLINKVAISSTVSHEQAFDNTKTNKFPSVYGNSGINTSLSLGKLMYPKKYKSLKQTNINLMLELVGQTIAKNGHSYLDIVPSIQFIINSQARIDVAYMKQMYSSMLRTAPNGVYLKFEYSFFNVF